MPLREPAIDAGSNDDDIPRRVKPVQSERDSVGYTRNIERDVDKFAKGGRNGKSGV